MTKRIIAIISILMVCVFVALPFPAAAQTLIDSVPEYRFNLGRINGVGGYDCTLNVDMSNYVTMSPSNILVSSDDYGYTFDYRLHTITLPDGFSTRARYSVWNTTQSYQMDMDKLPLCGGIIDTWVRLDSCYYYYGNDYQMYLTDMIRTQVRDIGYNYWYHAYKSDGTHIGTYRHVVRVSDNYPQHADLTEPLQDYRYMTYDIDIDVNALIANIPNCQYIISDGLSIDLYVNMYFYNRTVHTEMSPWSGGLRLAIYTNMHYKSDTYNAAVLDYLHQQQILDDAMGPGFDGSAGQQSVGNLSDVEGQVSGLIDHDAINNALAGTGTYAAIRGGVQAASGFMQYMFLNVDYLSLLIPLAIVVGAVGLLLGLVKNR